MGQRHDRKVSTTIYLTREQDEALEQLSRATDIPKAVMIRRGVDLALDWYANREELIEKGAAQEDDDAV